ncbi:O-antigen ligase family protein [Pseudomonas sp. JI-2]|nr:O-antigen ligase family protein [Pseudomonas sp. JI-2]
MPYSSQMCFFSTAGARAYFPIFFYLLSLVLLLLWRPNIDIGFVLTPTYLMFLLAIPLIFIKRQVYFYRFDFFLILFYFFSLLTSSYAPDPGTSVRFFLGVTVFLGIYLCFKLSAFGIDIDSALSAFGRLGKYYFSAALIFYMAGFIAYGSWQEHQIYYGLMVERTLPRLVAFGFDPNLSAITLIPFIFYFMLGRRSYVWLFLGLFLLFATMSRGAVLSMIIGLIGLAVFKPTKATIAAVGITFLLVVVGATLLFFFDVLPMSYLEQRMSGFISGSGRTEIWLNAWEMFSLRPIIGWGGFSFRDVNQVFFDDPRFAHNTYIEVLVESGIVGFFVFAGCVFLMLRRSISMGSDPRLLFVMPAIFSFAVSMFFLSVYINQVFIFYLSLLNFNWVKESA